MAITLNQVEYILIKRIGTLFADVGLDGTTTVNNTDLTDPIGWALRQLGLTPSSQIIIVDADLANVASTDYDQLFDLAEYRCLQNASGNTTGIDIRVGPRQESFSQAVAGLEGRIARKKQQLEEDYNFGGATLEAGVIALDFTDDSNA